MKSGHLKIFLIMILYYLLVNIVSNFVETELTSSTLFNILLSILEITIPLFLFYKFFVNNISNVKSLYLSCLLALTLCALGHFVVRIYVYQFIDKERSSIIADKIASKVVSRIESLERNNNVKVDLDKSSEYQKVYTKIKSKYEIKGIIKSTLTDIFIYSIIAALFVYFIKRKMLKTHSN